jgi:hypothetical protein
MRRPAVILAALAALGGCQTMRPLAAACPVGQEQLRTAQIFLGRQSAGQAPAKADLQRFIDQEIRPRFTDGYTVLDGGPKWRADPNMLIRDATKVVTVVLPPRGDRGGRVEAVRAAYRARFNQETVVVVSEPSCVAL